MVKIVATITEFGAAANCGGAVTSESGIINVPTENIPRVFREFLERTEKMKAQGHTIWEGVSFSILREDEEVTP